MLLLNSENLALPGAKVIRFGRYKDHRGYFTEPYRASDLAKIDPIFDGLKFLQANESYSQPGVMRGLHFQWEPPMGKLIRLLYGWMVDMMLDLRVNSPTWGKIILYELKADPQADFDSWLWLPPGLAHGVFFLKKSLLEYFCTSEYNAAGEGGLSPLSEDLDWSLCDNKLRDKYLRFINNSKVILSEKDILAPDFTAWQKGSLAGIFPYGGEF
jgi:dTDP-4-dehydrorhamnose 3,5-epimerase